MIAKTKITKRTFQGSTDTKLVGVTDARDIAIPYKVGQ